MNSERPYTEESVTTVVRKYNPKYGDDRMCKCGHSYYRHFDSYDGMYPCGCKYCGCTEFDEAVIEETGKPKCICCGIEFVEKSLKVCHKCASEYKF